MLADTAGGKTAPAADPPEEPKQAPIKPPPPAVEPEPSKLPELEKNLGVAQAAEASERKATNQANASLAAPRGA